MDIAEIRKKAKKLREEDGSSETEAVEKDAGEKRQQAVRSPASEAGPEAVEKDAGSEGVQAEPEPHGQIPPPGGEQRPDTAEAPYVAAEAETAQATEPSPGAQMEVPPPGAPRGPYGGAGKGGQRVREPELEAVTFMLDNEEYAIEIDMVKEVIKQRELTDVPRAPTHILGVLSLRGMTVPIMDLRGRLGLPEKNGGGLIIIVKDGDEVLGFLVDSVRRVVRVPLDSLEDPPGIKTEGAELIRAIGRDNDESFILLQMDKVLEGV